MSKYTGGVASSGQGKMTSETVMNDDETNLIRAQFNRISIADQEIGKERWRWG